MRLEGARLGLPIASERVSRSSALVVKIRSDTKKNLSTLHSLVHIQAAKAANAYATDEPPSEMVRV